MTSTASRARRLRRLLYSGALFVAVCIPAGTAVAANVNGSTTANVTVNGGTISFCSAPPSVSFGDVALSGGGETIQADTALDVCNATGGRTGWSISATSTPFMNGSYALPLAATSIRSVPLVTCDPGSQCTGITDSVSYPVTIPAGTTPPTPAIVFAAGAGSGTGNQTVTSVFSVVVPAGAPPGAYTANWVFSIALGP